ncbi:N-6 DNA methylase [Aneurinibacillus thermoaerophilus]|uniref:site-specific DNA-methyltransferase (adenine-specific) n=2 Tax=Aneurinibacillus thermoaerophilus TaxID=143495 RepID=A0A1G8AK75_ANETH|nr:N-6 DNA methylase [Aneurinibacillus thermoaerophilus]MED0678613.1 N-6 DNA methylase [Aneurinibacillus thermoaerophilus]MED0756567.1 N-6 DNA methylase [Aneurinibacillus thermoaerophilus]MED0760536.1 N-6 DNA methylase [Aneurinibacillus thermoaerophilus]MED0765351.1 N-6 DNA methylase [Aneurinibacillus thermoaerophilus]QYY42754.1 N-6 DNA methylase [Aneurinibacillus thermoaerophilus]
MSVLSVIKSVQDIMRKDAGIDGDAQRISQLVWMVFLKVFDAKEEEWERLYDNYEPIIPEGLRWRDWTADDKGMTDEELLGFVNNKLFKGLKELHFDGNSHSKACIVRSVFEDSYNYMKSGALLRQVIRKLNEIDFTTQKDRHIFNDIYETILKDLQSAGNAGEYYTPRPVTQFVVNMVNPRLGEKVLDFACGTGGYLLSALEHLRQQIKSVDDNRILQETIIGIEKKPLPYMLAVTNMILHDIDIPKICRDNFLTRNVEEYKPVDKVDVIMINPPFGGKEEDGIASNFPLQFRTKETADLFMVLLMYLLKENGRACVILPDNFLFEKDTVKINIKKKLLREWNVHTIVRLPKGVFEPYTDIETNLLFIEGGKSTEHIWYFEHPLPDEYKKYSKTRPIRYEEFEIERKWWNNRSANEHAWLVSIHEITERNYNLDIKNPNKNKNDDCFSADKLRDVMINTSTKAINLMEERKKNTIAFLDYVRSINRKRRKYKIGQLLTRIKDTLILDDETQYKRVTIKLNHGGIYLRDIVYGKEIGTKRQFKISRGQFLLSRIDARNGAFGIVPEELEGAIITGNFWTYEAKHELLNIDWFNLFTSTSEFMAIVKESSSGTTNRKYLDERKFLQFEISLPDKAEQDKFMQYYSAMIENYESLKKELERQNHMMGYIKDHYIG